MPNPPDALLDPLRADPGGTAIVTDFDGTLSPIVVDPAAAGPLPGVVDALHRLATRYGKVAIVSGRPVAFLRDRLELDARPPSRLLVSGLYGIEWLEDGVERIDRTAIEFKPEIDEAAVRAEAAAPPGVHVERKGWSVTLHVRTAEDQLEWARSWSHATAHTTGLAVHEGKKSFELRPPIDVDKGTVVDDVVRDMAGACFLGDDLGDLPAFDALDRLRARTGAHTVRVGVRSAEAPIELLERSDLTVDGPAGALEVLRALLD